MITCHACHTRLESGESRCQSCGLLLVLQDIPFDDRNSMAKEYRETWFKRQENLAYVNACKSLIPIIGLYYSWLAIHLSLEGKKKSPKTIKKESLHKFTAFQRLGLLSLVCNILGILLIGIGIFKIAT
ncbi:MAG: hypothetical protein RIR17_769 [Planctomycetota bacterium]